MNKGHKHLLPLKKRANLDANPVLLRTDIINVVGRFWWMHINPAAGPDISARVHAPAFQQSVFNTIQIQPAEITAGRQSDSRGRKEQSSSCGSLDM